MTWKLGSPVSRVDEQGVQLDNGERIEASTVVWTVGVKASPLTQQIDGERDAFGRLHVDRHLRVLGQDEMCIRDRFSSVDLTQALLDAFRQMDGRS